MCTIYGNGAVSIDVFLPLSRLTECKNSSSVRQMSVQLISTLPSGTLVILSFSFRSNPGQVGEAAEPQPTGLTLSVRNGGLEVKPFTLPRFNPLSVESSPGSKLDA